MNKEKIPFEIERLDPLGQGVSKINDKISFIPKTLPGESGLAQVIGRKKGVQFAQVKEITTASSQRITPECPHYSECSGCSYLHTSYDVEIENKFKSFERQVSFSSFNKTHISSHAAPNRLGYRNRIQLHYDLKKKQLGFFRGKSQSIHDAKECKLASKKLGVSLSEFYKDWEGQVPPHAPVQGHVELYEKDDEILIAWNEHYSAGGFSQVNKLMNDKAISIWNEFYDSIDNPQNVLDVFGGSGNLSRSFTKSKVKILDSFCNEKLLLDHQSFTQADLYKNPEIPDGPVDLLIFDPPRSGFKEASEWIEQINPRYVGYQSCFADTMMRDLKNLPGHWEAIEIHLLDFFPSTHHFEAMILLKNTRAK